jgi:membrane associated rhomboid family serine protease
VTATSPVPARRARILPARPVRAALFMIVFAALLWAIEAADLLVFHGALDVDGGIIPRRLDGLDGIAFSPLLHANWAHLAANTVPFLVFGFLVLANGVGQFLAVTALIWVLGGAMVWLTGSPGVTVGASGVIFGWLAFLLVRGFFARPRAWGQIGLAVVLLLVYGGVLWGVLPGTPGVSWQAHLFGALAGVLAARLVASADRPRTREQVQTPPIGS